MTSASILVPTHDHWATLGLAVRSALAQVVQDLEVLIVGDGATPEVRAVAQALARADPRVRFLDQPKGPNHGEVYRGTAIEQARSDAIFYLCDDDLLLDTHVANLLDLLVEADLVQCRNGYFTTDGRLELFPGDLADPQCVAWHLREPRRNATSLTGTAHSRTAYLALAEGWTTTPENEWPDHFMWKKFLRMPGFRGATHSQMTALQFPTSAGRELQTQADRAAELDSWADLLLGPDGPGWLEEEVGRAAERRLVAEVRRASDREDLVMGLQADLAQAQAQREDAVAREIDAVAREIDAVAREAEALGRVDELERLLDGVRRSRSWRTTSPIRASADLVRGLLRRQSADQPGESDAPVGLLTG